MLIRILSEINSIVWSKIQQVVNGNMSWCFKKKKHVTIVNSLLLVRLGCDFRIEGGEDKCFIFVLERGMKDVHVMFLFF